jgi:hypothetical protein
MAETLDGATFEFRGKLTGLTIIVNGRVLYTEKEDAVETRSAAVIRAQKKHATVSSFASCVNKIPVLSKIWRTSYFRKSNKASIGKDKIDREYAGKASAFNKIMAANKRLKTLIERPTEKNLIVPGNRLFLPSFTSLLLSDELIVKFVFKNYNAPDFRFKEKAITGAAIICPYNPKDRTDKRFELFPKWNHIVKFIPSETLEINLAISDEERDIIKKYNECLLYFTLVLETSGGRIIDYFSTEGVSSSLENYDVSPVVFTNHAIETEKVELENKQ